MRETVGRIKMSNVGNEWLHSCLVFRKSHNQISRAKPATLIEICLGFSRELRGENLRLQSDLFQISSDLIYCHVYVGTRDE
jgi:hypothetical protein